MVVGAVLVAKKTLVSFGELEPAIVAGPLGKELGSGRHGSGGACLFQEAVRLFVGKVDFVRHSKEGEVEGYKW